MQLIKRSSSVVRHTMHMCFKVKYCHKVFQYARAEQLCRSVFCKVSAENKWIIYELGFDKDHVHLVIDIGFADVSVVAKKLKGTSAKKMLRTFPWMKRQYFWKSGFWSAAYFADSVGRNAEQILYYVRNQGKPKQPISQTNLGSFLNTASL